MVSWVLVIDEAIPSQSRYSVKSGSSGPGLLMHGQLAPIFVRRCRHYQGGDLRRLKAAWASRLGVVERREDLPAGTGTRRGTARFTKDRFPGPKP
jgi:hypothetical protein